MLPIGVETIVHPHAAASSAGFGVPSVELAQTYTVPVLYQSAISAAVRLPSPYESTRSSSQSIPSPRRHRCKGSSSRS